LTHAHSVSGVLSVDVETLKNVSVVGGFGNVFDDSILVGDSSLTGLTLEELVVEVSGGRVEDTRGSVRVRPVKLCERIQVSSSSERTRLL